MNCLSEIRSKMERAHFCLGVVVAIAIGVAVCLSLQSCKNGKRSEAQKDVALSASVFRQSASCDTFLLNDGVSEFRVSLYNAFPPEYLATHDVYIVERTRHIDSVSNLTVWYRLEKGTLHPVDSLLWRNDAEF